MNGKVTEPFQVSLSAFQSWQKCEQKYYYGYVRGLRPRDQFLAPTLGRILHTYLEGYYNALSIGETPENAHLRSQLSTSTKYTPEIRGYINVALAAGQEELARELNDLLGSAGRITDRYYYARGRADSERFKVLHVEKRLRLEIAPNIRSNGIVDLITEDQETGRLNLWEHKSTKNIPEGSVRLRDFQTMLYAIKVRMQYGIIVDSVIWNYLRTKEPVVPEVLKSGSITKRKDLDSTWEVYSAAIRAANGNPNSLEYAEVKERLFGREQTIFFPRYEQVIVVSEDLLMHDYIVEAKRMALSRANWEAGVGKPIRTISRDCDYCEFFRVCQAALTGGDEEDVISLRFTT